MADIIIFSNVERQYQRLEQAHILLVKEGILQPGCRSLFFSSSSVWDGAAEKEIKDAKAVFLIWQGKVFPNAFSEEAEKILRKNRIPYGIFSSTLNEIEAARDVSAEEIALVSRYLSYSGQANYRSLWLWLALFLSRLRWLCLWSDITGCFWCGFHLPVSGWTLPGC